MAGVHPLRRLFVRRRKRRAPKFYRTTLNDFMVSWRTSARGKWQALRPGAQSFLVPGRARGWKVRLRTPGAPLEVYETTRAKSKGGVSLGLKRLLSLLNSPPKRGRAKYETVLEYLNRVLGHWRLSVGVVPLARYYADGAFFTDPADLKKKWDRIRIWYAIESDGMSDGSPLKEDEKAYHIGTTYFEVKGAKLGTALLERFRDIVDDRLFHVDDGEEGGEERNGIAIQHNSATGLDGQPLYKQWKETAILLATEGVPMVKRTGGVGAIPRKTGPGRGSKRVRSRQ